jgi:ABC-2 type transport system permease protein
MRKYLYRRVLLNRGLFKAAVKQSLAYPMSLWLNFFAQALMIVISVYFWKAVYANQSEIGGMNLNKTINYMILSQMLSQMVQQTLIGTFGELVRHGSIGIELLRPVDLQWRYYFQDFALFFVMIFLHTIPLGLFAVVFFHFQITVSIKVWMCFILSIMLGRGIAFFFDWIFTSLTFYTSESWGLYVLHEGITSFFGGAFLPIAMFPGILKKIADCLPFSQSLYIPVSILNGMIPENQIAVYIFRQIIWLLALVIISRVIFSRAVRSVTVQGG